MKFTVNREQILRPLQIVAGVVERKQTMPVLANVLMVIEGNSLSLTGTDLEVEIVGRLDLDKSDSDGEITVPAKKLLDICRALPENAALTFTVEEQKAVIKSGRSRFTLSTLPSAEFPAVERGSSDLSFHCSQREVKEIIERTSFAMAQQDVRYYLNGMLWEVKGNQLRAVSTDGHRLAMCTKQIQVEVEEHRQAILPRKGVIELSKILTEEDTSVEIVVGSNHIRAITQGYTFTTKLIDAKFPDYERVVPQGGNKVVIGDRAVLRQAFARTAILANEKYRGVRLFLDNQQMTLMANNPEQEEAEDVVPVDYDGGELEVGFNISYLQDVTNVLDDEKIKITLSDSNSSALIEAPENSDSAYVVMPMRM